MPRRETSVPAAAMINVAVLVEDVQEVDLRRNEGSSATGLPEEIRSRRRIGRRSRSSAGRFTVRATVSRPRRSGSDTSSSANAAARIGPSSIVARSNSATMRPRPASTRCAGGILSSGDEIAEGLRPRASRSRDRAGSDVDTACRLVGDHHARPTEQVRAKRTFLLVAARQRWPGGSRRRALAARASRAPSCAPAPASRPRRRRARASATARVLRHRPRVDQSVVAVQDPHQSAPRLGEVSPPDASGERDGSRLDPVGPEHRASSVRPAPTRPCEDLASAEIEGRTFDAASDKCRGPAHRRQQAS